MRRWISGEGAAPEDDVEGAFFLLEEGADVFVEVGGDLVQGGEGRRTFIGLEEGDELGGEAEGAGAADRGLGSRRQIFTPHLHFLVSEGGVDGALFLGE
jgi:hypothetical protein